MHYLRGPYHPDASSTDDAGPRPIPALPTRNRHHTRCACPPMGQQPDTMTDQGRLESGESSHSEKAPPTGLGSRLSAHFSQEVDVKKAWIPLLLLCFVTGILDGTIYNGTF